MKFSRILSLISVTLFLFDSNISFAQGGLQQDIEVETDYKPIVADAVKIKFEAQTPAIKPDTSEIKYEIPLKFLDITFRPVQPKPLAMPKENWPDYMSSYIKLGFGNHTTSLIDAAYNDGNHPRNNDAFRINYGARFHHLSSNGGMEFQDFSENDVNVYTDLYPGSVKGSLSFDYNRDAINYYGFDSVFTDSLTKDSVQQYFNHYGFNASVKNSKKNDAEIDYGFTFHYGMLGDHFDNKENNLLLNLNATKKFENKHFITLNIREDHSSLNFSPDTTINLFTITPKYIYKTESWLLQGGVNLTWDQSTFHVLPEIELQRSLASNYLIFYSGWKAFMMKNSYSTLVDDNPFVSSNLDFMNSRVEDRYVGIKGTVLDNFSYNVKLGIKRVFDLPLFLNDFDEGHDAVENAKFKVIYDPDASITTIHTELAYNVNERLRFSILGNYNQYALEDSLNFRAWHLPQLEANFVASYNIGNKIILNLDVFGANGLYSKGEDAVVHSIGGYVDVNFNATYVFNKNLSVFCSLNNIASQKYQRWYNYPRYGFTGIGGVKFTF